MEEKLFNTAVIEKQTDKPAQTQSQAQSLKVNLTKLKSQASQKENRVVRKDQINFFGGQKTDLPKHEQEQKNTVTEVVDKSASSVIEKPNYDFIKPISRAQQKKIFKIEKQKVEKKSTSPLLKKIKIITFAIIFAVFGSWTIYNAVEITQYDLKLDQYLLKLGTLDSASNANDLFPTYPEEGEGADGMASQSNWFDRFCNFVGRLFGG